MLIRLKRIYNFWCSMLVLYQLLHVLHLLYITFIHFLGLTYKQDAEVPVPVFCCFCIPEKLVWKYSRNWTKLHGGAYFSRTRLTERRSSIGGTPGGHTPPGHGPPFCRALGWCGPLGGPQPPPFRLLIPPDAKTLSTWANIHEKIQRRRRRQP